MEQKTGIQRAIEMAGSPAKLAESIGNGVLRQHVEHWLKVGRVSAERAPEVANAFGIPLEDLNDRVNWALVREQPSPQAGADGAPDVAATEGVSHG